MAQEIRLEVNIDIVKRDITPEQVLAAVRKALHAMNFQYVEVQAIKVVK